MEEADSRVYKYFRINTCKSVSKHTTLTLFRMNTYEKHRGRGGGELLLTRLPIGNASFPERILRLLPASPRAGAFQQLIDGANEFMTRGAQFSDAMLGHLRQHALAAWQERHQHAPPVVSAPRSPHVTVGLKPADQFHYAVVLQCEALCQRPDRGLFALRKPPDGQQQQILLGFQARPAGDGVAFTDEVPDKVAQLRQCAIFRRGDLSCHGNSIS